MKKRYNERKNKVQSKSLGGYMGKVMAGRGGSFKGSS